MNEEMINENKLDMEKIKGIFKKYRKMNEVSNQILDSFIALDKDDKGFLIDNEPGDERKKSGIITDAMALSTLLELNAMDANLAPHYPKLLKLVENIFNRVYGEDKTIAIFDATPYLFNDLEKGLELNSYVETMSKILISMTDFRDFLIENKFEKNKIKVDIKIWGEEINSIEALQSCVETIIIDSIKALTDSCLVNDNPYEYSIEDRVVDRHKLPKLVKYRGWTFKKTEQSESKDYEPSIYFTYHATNAYLCFYQSFYKYFDKEFEDKPYSINEFSKKEVTKDDANKKFFNDNLELFADFREKVVSAGRFIETKMSNNHVDLAFDFINKDFTPVSISTVINAQDNNYVINTLFVLAILINSGIDDDYKQLEKKDYFYNQINYSLTNIKKIYTVLTRLNREDFINSYSLVLDEKCAQSSSNVVKELRKRCKNIEVYDLIPLYCNTYSVVSKYLVQFPQTEMGDIYKMIIANKIEDDNVWLWSSDGFNINNNLYYIFALENFYAYYYEYEEPLLNADITHTRYIQQKKDFEIEKEQLIANLKKEHKEELLQKDKEIQEYKEKYENKKSRLDSEVINLLNQNIDKVMTDYLKDMVYQNRMYSLIRYKVKNGDYTGIEQYKNAGIDAISKDFPKAALLNEISFAIDNQEIINGIDFNKIAGIDPNELYEKVDETINKKIKDKVNVR